MNEEAEKARQKVRREIGKACLACSHPEGVHQMLGGEELDEPINGSACRYKHCACIGFRAA